MDMQLALNQEYEARHLPAIEAMRFNGNPVFWPEFIDNFYQNVHSKMTFSDNIRMTRLSSLLDGDAKKAIQSIGSSDLFYASALKTLKRDFGNPLLVATLRMKRLFDKPQINGRDRNALRDFHQQLKMNNTWLMSMEYDIPLLSSESLTKDVMRLPYSLRQEFFKATRDYNLIDGSVNIIVFENRLERKLETYFNLLSDIIAPEDTSPRYQNPKKNKNLKINNILSVKEDHNIMPATDDKEESKNIKCCLCTKPHRLMDGDNFKGKTADERKEYIKSERPCYKCFSKGHNLKECKWKYRVRIDHRNKRHYSLIHTDKETKSNQAVDEEIQNDSITWNKIYDRNKKNNLTYLQVLPINVSNGDKTFRANTLLDSGSDSKLISKTLVDKLNTCGGERSLTITNVMSTKLKIKSKLVNLSVSSNFHPSRIEISNAWVIDNLHLPSYTMTKLISIYETLILKEQAIKASPFQSVLIYQSYICTEIRELIRSHTKISRLDC